MKLYDKRTGFLIADPEIDPLRAIETSPAEMKKAFSDLILSASGWRKIFASDGNEESVTPELAPADKIIAGTMAVVFSKFLRNRKGPDNPVAAVGLDSRYTGPAMADIIIRILLSQKIKVRYLFISAAPEIMAYAKQSPDIDGFVYISASHNPVGHNGLKFGLDNGGVIGGDDPAELISDFTETIFKKENQKNIKDLCASVSTETLEGIYRNIPIIKNNAMAAYKDFSKKVITGLDSGSADNPILNELKRMGRIRPLGILGELNGSARTLSIDGEFLEEAGIRVKILNGNPREIVHRIVPEGISLNLCRGELEKIHANENAFTIGYVPDNDGDRGNVVYIDKESAKAKILQAQDIFALACIAELSYSAYLEDPVRKEIKKQAVVVNGPTSLRIEKIAAAFGASVFRAEVGEANVVSLARKKREEGFSVRILGEGSNGGNITHPAAVRDPLNTIFALIKMLLLKGTSEKKGLFRTWFDKSGQRGGFPEDFTISDIINTIPRFCSTSAFEKEAVIKIIEPDHALLKERYEKIFYRQWDSEKERIKEKFGFCSFEEINYEGTEAKKGFGKGFRSGNERGGFKILFRDKEENQTGFIWMRGSGTEPVFRVLADIEGTNSAKEKELLAWHKDIIKKADKLD